MQVSVATGGWRDAPISVLRSSTGCDVERNQSGLCRPFHARPLDGEHQQGLRRGRAAGGPRRARHSRNRLVPLAAIAGDRGARRRRHASVGAGMEGNRHPGARQQSLASRSPAPSCRHPSREDRRARIEPAVSWRHRPSQQDGAARSGRTPCQPGLPRQRAALRRWSLRGIWRGCKVRRHGTPRNVRRQRSPRAVRPAPMSACRPRPARLRPH